MIRVPLPPGATIEHGELVATLPAANALKGALLNATRSTMGRPRRNPRCPCGAMTIRRAEQRRHVCTEGVG